MWNRFIDEAARNLFRFIIEFIVVESARQEALTCYSDRDTARIRLAIHRLAPFFSNFGSCATAAGGGRG